ncbi:Long-chain-fatty-acid--CoA ligase ACSBG2 [Amphibalanus amphitrite]|uniref:long-chain-fatty-acid--CoA ligase n=1 Tax=Amphibalanus amphitrite TaxID=1232801 RepID=A0A6A4WC68_AMPAM|nr:Long-chain-fatty-acid--CoA ligase ACSBG2 [Amphibalanus amphitrite]
MSSLVTAPPHQTNGSLYAGNKIAISVPYEKTDVTDRAPPPPRPEHAFETPSSSGTGSTGSSPDGTPTSGHTKSTASPAELVTRLGEQLKQVVPARRETPEKQPAPAPAKTPAPTPAKAPAPPAAAPSASRYNDGPDQVVPTEELNTTDRFGAVKLKIGNKGPSAERPISVHSLLRRSANKYGHVAALRTKRDGVWQTITYKAYLEQVECVARAFIKLGLEPKSSVCILGFNSPEWFLSALGAAYAGGVAAGVYTTNNVEACFHCAADSNCNIFVVEDEKQLAKVMQFRDKVPSLKAVVQYSGTPSSPGVIGWSQLMEMGAKEGGEELERRVRQVAVNQVAFLIYTSGTTGPPKGVMLSHDNVTFMATNCVRYFGLRPAEEQVVSYLPLSHVAAMIADIFLPMACAGTTSFADKNALKGTLGQTLAEVRPTCFIGVPRVFEKIKEGFETKVGQTKGLRRSLLEWALERGRISQTNRIAGSQSKPFGYGLARRLVLCKIHRVLGLDRVRLLYSGAAPLAKDTLTFFHSLDLPLLQLYGMSESSGPHTACLRHVDKTGSVGPTLEGFATRLDKPDSEGQGEICMGGRNVFMGYLNLPDKTEEAVDADGWLHSGDLGTVDNRGVITITGRSKVVVDLDTMEPTNQLSPPALEFCRSVGSTARTVQDVLDGPDEKVMSAIQRGLDRANQRAASGAQRVQKWSILPVDFSIPGGEIGPTMKMKRPVIHKKYAQVIERFYS